MIRWPQAFELSGDDLTPPATPEPSRHMALSDTASLIFKESGDALRCALTRTAAGIRIDPGSCQRTVRLMIALGSLGDWLREKAEADHRVRLRVELRTGEHSSSALEWLAFLRTDVDGAGVFWARVGEGLVLPAAETASWSVKTPSRERHPDVGEIALALQLAAGAPPFELSRLSIRPVRTWSERGEVSATETGVTGWVQTTDDIRLALSVAGRTAGTFAVSPPEAPSGTPRRFAVGWDALRKELTPTDAAQPLEVVLEAGGDALAALSTRLSPGASRHPDPVTPASPATPPPSLLDDSEALAASSVDTILKVFRWGATSPSLVRDTMQALYREKEREKIWHIHDGLSELGDEGSVSPGVARFAYVQLVFSRIMLEMNASETAYQGFKWLLTSDAAFAGIDESDRSRTRKLFARACLRSGRADEALALHRIMMHRNPKDWEAYFQIGTIIGARDPQSRQVYYRAARKTVKKLPALVATVMAEASLEEGRPDEAMEVVLECITQGRSSPELKLNLANIHLALQQKETWQAYVADFFRDHGLTPPPFTAGEFRLDDLFAIPERTGTAWTEPPAHPDITIIMTAFNAETTITNAIQSVRAQTYTNWRLVVVDDVSSDGTVEIVTRLQAQDRRIELIRNTTNVGTYWSKNKGIQSFTSEFYAFHDSDDWMHPQRIEKHLERMMAEPGLVCSTSNWYRMDRRGHAAVRRAGGFLHENPASTFVRRAALLDAGLFDTVRTGADSEFAWRLRRRYGEDSTTNLGLPLAIGLQHDTSLTQAGAAAFDEHRYSPVRLAYWEAWVNWHRRTVLEGDPSTMYMPFPHMQRRFVAPGEILP